MCLIRSKKNVENIPLKRTNFTVSFSSAKHADICLRWQETQKQGTRNQYNPTQRVILVTLLRTACPVEFFSSHYTYYAQQKSNC